MKRKALKISGINPGLALFSVLIAHGVMTTTGVRTSKRFSLRQPQRLLEEWSSHYSIVRKCRMRSYRTAFAGKEELLEILRDPKLTSSTALALHSAAEAHGYSYSNLTTLELYVTQPSAHALLEEALQLEPQERGYEVLLIEPYYKTLLHRSGSVDGGRVAPLLLTYLDLYHFPLRRREGANFIAQRAEELKRIG